MITKTQTSHSSFFPRIGFRSASKGAPAPPPPQQLPDDDDDWFTPYNGPYEIPTDMQHPHPGARDSWGAVLSSAMQNEDVLPGPEYEQRDGGQGQGEGRGGSIRRRNTHGRARAASTVSRLTMSSGMVDPQMQAHNPGSPSKHTPPRRTPPSSSNPQDGGVGESPMPLQRHQSPSALPSPPANPPNRLSLASFLTFGQSAKRLTLTRTAENSPVDYDTSQPSTPATGSLRRRKSKRGRALTAEPLTPEEDDYYNSYYSTLISTPKPDTRFTRSTDPPDAPRSAPPARSGHPYAYTPSTPSIPAAPLVTVSASYKGKGVDRAFQYPRPPPVNTLSPSGNAKPSMRNSILKAISTPNLRAFATSPSGSKAAGSTASRPKQRWLSPETWCDALLFPRPRFAMRVDESNGHVRSDRIVSPPGSPIIAWAAKQGDADGVPTWRDDRITDTFTLSGRPSLSGSRPGRIILPKSRSAINLSTIASEAGSSRSPPTATPMFLEPRAVDGMSGQRDRPRSFAHDDLSLPSPVPSLAKVLEAAENLERERKAWKSQASTSFQNKFSRSMSRARSKSVGNARARLKEPQHSVGNIDFLAARTFLGSQAIAPKVHVRPATSTGTASTGTHSRTHSRKSTKSHAQSNSMSTSSRSQARTHSRNESWGKSALRTATHMCIPDAERLSPNPNEEPKTQFDNSLRAGETKVLRLEDQIMSERRREDPSVLSPSSALAMAGGLPTGLTMPSPTPSGLTVSTENGVAVGIALSSPPPSDDHSQQISMPSHPYAQGGFSSSSYIPHHEHQRSTATTSTQYRGSDYAGPHPSSPHVTMQPVANDVASRHRLPPHAILHPYAQASHAYQSGLFEQGESQPDPAAESVPASATHLQSGGRMGHAYATGDRYSGGPLGLDDALAYALRRVGSVDSGLGASVEHASPTNLNALSLATPPPARPPAAHASSSGNTQQTNHTVPSTPPSRLNPPFFRNPSSTAATAGTSPSPGVTSRSSSPQPSLHAFSTSEDLDRYRDLFYKPGRTPSDGLKRDMSATTRESSGVPVDVGSRSSRAGSGFTTLARQLTEELENMPFESPADEMWGRRYGGLRGERPRESATNPNVVLAVAAQDGAGEATLPLRLHREASQQVPDTPRISFPEDVESSRASSFLERSPVDSSVGHDEVLRLGIVEAVSTPAAETADHRFSGHVSLVDDGVRDSEDTIRASDVTRPNRIISQTSSLGPPVPLTATDHTRSSYMTTSTGSRMSGLSDFPVPPDQLVATPAQVSLLNSYFGEVSQPQLPQPRPVLEPGDKPSPARSPYRTTFGSIGDLTQPH